jgi:hypothetical protein
MLSDSVPWKVLSSVIGVGKLTAGWTLHQEVDDPSPDESRSFHVTVPFSSAFAAPPVVHLGITGLDLDQRDSGRVTLKLEQITCTDFTATVSTWSATRLHAVEFSWFAIGG